MDKLNCPILLLQGDEDKIVLSPIKRRRCTKALLEKKVPTAPQDLRGRAARLEMKSGEYRGRIELGASGNFRECLADCLKLPNPEIEVFPIDNLAP